MTAHRRLLMPVFALSSCLYLAMLVHFFYGLLRGDLSYFTMFGAPASIALFLFYLFSNAPGKERAWVWAGAFLLEGLRITSLHHMAGTGGEILQNSQSIYFGTDPQDFSIYFGFPNGFGIGAGIAVTAALWLRATHTKLADNTFTLHVIALMLAQIFMLYSMTIVSWIALTGFTFDTELHRFETMLGVYVPAWFGVWFERYPLLAKWCTFTYGTLAGAVLVGYFLQTRQDPKPPVNLLAASGIAACASFIYFLVPGCGPYEIFGERFPHHIPFTDYTRFTISPDPTLWRNAMPSLHATWALLLAIQLYYFHPKRALGFAAVMYAASVIAATMGTGAHYFVDIVVALPLTLLVQALASHTIPFAAPERKGAAITGALLMVVWLVWLCFFPLLFNFYNAWGMVLFTTIFCFYRLKKLVRVSRYI